MSDRIRIGVVGAGLVAQWLHIPNLIRLSELYDLVGVCDPSAEVRDFVSRRFGVATFPDSDGLLENRLDAVLIASPDFTHVQETQKALAHGLHVFCEKPLCYAPSDADAIAQARDRAGKVVQVGYMKRHDRAYEECLDRLPDSAGKLRYVSVEVIDPDFAPYAAAHLPVATGDLPPGMIAAGRRAKSAQIAAALGFQPSAAIEKGFADRYCSSLVHDVNAVAGMFDRIGESTGGIIGAALFADGGGGTATWRTTHGDAVCHMSHIALSGIPEYRERIALYFEDVAFDLRFPSPYLVDAPTRLVVTDASNGRCEKYQITSGYGSAFVNELKAFRSSVLTGAPVRNTVELARRDIALLCDLARHVAGRKPIYRESAAQPASNRQAGGDVRQKAVQSTP